MIGAVRRGDPPPEEVELLDAEMFELPRRLSLEEACDHSGLRREPHRLNADEPGDDR